LKKGWQATLNKNDLIYMKEINLKNSENILRTMNIAQEIFYLLKKSPSQKFDHHQSVEEILSPCCEGLLHTSTAIASTDSHTRLNVTADL
jgi:hypothetical protein